MKKSIGSKLEKVAKSADTLKKQACREKDLHIGPLALRGTKELASRPPAFKNRRVYVIAHRVNDANAIFDALSRGANAVECDVRFGSLIGTRDQTWVVDHDFAHKWSTRLEEWLKKASAACERFESHFAAILFDIKTPRHISVELYQLVRKLLPEDMAILFCVASYSERECLKPLIPLLGPKDGLSMDQGNEVHDVVKWFDEVEVQNCWYGDGIFVAGITDKDIPRRIAFAVSCRDKYQKPRRVYTWTLRERDSIQVAFDHDGCDGVMVNLPNIDTAVAAATKYQILAKRHDSAF